MCDQPCDATPTSAPHPPCSEGWVLEGVALRRGLTSVRARHGWPASVHRRHRALPLVPLLRHPPAPALARRMLAACLAMGSLQTIPNHEGNPPRPCPKLAHKSRRYKNKTVLCLHAHFRLPFKPELVSHTLAEEQRGAGVKRQARKINAYFSLAAREGLP